MSSLVNLVIRNYKVRVTLKMRDFLSSHSRISFAYVLKAIYPPVPAKEEGALRCGILGAARIAPSAIITPAKSHPEVIIHAVAARDKSRADAFAKKYKIPKAYSGPQGYQGQHIHSMSQRICMLTCSLGKIC